MPTRVKSLNKTELVFEPGSTTSYSNMALATVGYVLERTQKEPFAKLMQRKLLDPIGMKDSSFRLTPEIAKKLPKATMWTYHGREFPAPVFDFGMVPAGNLYSSVNDQAKFLKFLFAGGVGPNGHILKRETLEKMYTIQFPEEGRESRLRARLLRGRFRRQTGHPAWRRGLWLLDRISRPAR